MPTDCVACGSVVSDTTACGDVVSCVCAGTFSVGDRVTNLLANPSGATDLAAGTTGTVVNGWTLDGSASVGVRWDGYASGDDADCENADVAAGCGVCEDATSNNNWYVTCGEIIAAD
jgi:hypothetical protein